MVNFKIKIAFFVHVISRIFCLIPIDKKKIIFEAYMGKQYSCSPKYICEFLDNRQNGYNLIWVFQKDKILCKYPQIRRNSLSYFYHMLTAGTVILNSVKNKLLKFRNQQIVINTWHGGGAYKKIVHPGYDEHYRKNDYYLSSCKMASKYVIREGQEFYGEILEYGLPRNDVLISYDQEKAKCIKKKLGVSQKKCVLYAPTFRKDISKTEFALDYKRLISSLESKFGGDWIVLHRSHYHMKEHTSGNKFDDIIDVTKYPDMQELLLISDVLITDYSSSIWDYSFLYKPAFLYATDLKEYNIERSFFVDIHKWPFPLCENNEELENAIRNFEQKHLERSIQEHHKMMGSFETGRASEQVYKFIQEKLGEIR